MIVSEKSLFIKNKKKLAGFAATREVGNIRTGSSANMEAHPSASRLRNHTSFSSGLSSCNGLIPKFSGTGIGNENMGLHSPKDGSNGNSTCYISNFTTDSWTDSPKMFSGFNGAAAEAQVYKYNFWQLS